MKRVLKVLLLFLMSSMLSASISGGVMRDGVFGNGALSGSIGGPDDVVSGMPSALVDYNAGILSGTGQVTTIANTGTGGSGWDITQGTAGDRPTLHAACQNGKSCVRFNDATDQLSQAAAQSVTWAKTIMCFSINAVNDAGSAAWMAWAGTGVVKNALLDRSTNQQVVGDVGAQVITGSAASGWMAMCLDLTDPAAPVVSVNGGAHVTLGSLSTVSDPSQIRIGTDWANTAGWDFAGGDFGRLVLYNADPGKTTQELSQILANQWGL